MVSGELFDNLAEMMQTIRKDQRAFGGVQLIVTGDFCQLPPVYNSNDLSGNMLQRLLDTHASVSFDYVFMNRGYAFEATEWSRCKFETCRLSQVHRQSDQEMVSVLEQVRIGVVNQQVKQFVQECQRRPTHSSSSSSSSSSNNNNNNNNKSSAYPGSPFMSATEVNKFDSIVATQLFSKNVDADRVNKAEFRRLSGESKMFRARDSITSAEGVTLTQHERRALQQKLDDGKTFRAAKELQLKVGCQVMLLFNQPDAETSGLVNGSRGEVVDFVGANVLEADLTKQLQELESKHKGSKGGKHDEHDERQIQHVRQQLENVARHVNRAAMDCPTVKFQSGLIRTFDVQSFEYCVHGVGTAIRDQIPLMLAWAISIHKAQGMSIDKLKVAVGDAFAPGQTYVALSRAKSKEGLEISTWKDSCVKFDQRAVDFDATGYVANTWRVKAEQEWPQLMKQAILRDNLEAPPCNCGEGRKAVQQLCRTGGNAGKSFWACATHRDSPGSCGFFEWVPTAQQVDEEE